MDKYAIETVIAREILDSRGDPTIGVEIRTANGATGSASVPSGKSRGRYEAAELRDGGRRYHGRGVLRAVQNVNSEIRPKLIGMDVRKQEEIDNVMIQLDGTPNKSRLGANAILGVSIAVAKAASESEGLPLHAYVNSKEAPLLPVPFMNIINGGSHAGNRLDFQEHMVVPLKATGFSEALRMGVEVYHELREILVRKYGRKAIDVGDEGGFSPPMKTSGEALDTIQESIDSLGYQDKCFLALDVAASSFFYRDKGYEVEGEFLTKGELIDYCRNLTRTYSIVSLEDPLEEEDFEGFAELTRRVKPQVLGDDLFATSSRRLRQGIDIQAANGIIWKVNQVGTLTEAYATVELARENNLAVQAAHRSGETEDTFVADLAVGLSLGQIKTGAPSRGERTAKYNRLLRIEQELGEKARYVSKLSPKF